MKQKAKSSYQKNTISLSEIQTSTQIKQIVFACDAGMGSSVMGSAIFKKLLQKNNITNIEVVHKSIANLDGNETHIITISGLKDRVHAKNHNAQIFGLDQFLDQTKYQSIIDEVKTINQKR